MKINRYKSSNSSVPSSSANKSISSSSVIENNLKDGHISGSLSRENSKTFLSLSNGDKIEVKLQADMPLGRLMSFAAFKSPSGEIILKLSDSTKNVIMLDSLIKNFNLPDTDQIRELINLFMNKSLPLNRQELIKANFNSSNFNIPTHTITNLLAKSISLSPDQLLIAKDLINSGLLPLAKDISNAVVFNLDDANKQKILDFINRFNPANLGTESDLRYPANLGTASDLHSPVNLGSDANLGSTANFSQADLANLVSDFLLGLPLNSSTSQPLAINNNALQDFINLVALLNLDNVREDPSKPTIQERLDVLYKLESADFEFLSPMLLSNLLNGSVHFFNEKPHSSNTSKKSNGLYIVVALDLANLDHIEFHIHKFDKLLDIQIYVTNINLKKFLSSFSHSFSLIADECGLKINSLCHFVTPPSEMEATDSIEQKHEINPKLKEQRSFSSNFDFRV
ncbi:MAG: hypothetical protein ATN31_07465 [Candidatus Epulonipiscioides saccharophilum]|nr:MAG: hypothetical protein ATN31_07465 [Epulopiscium sp. AS2M-Bin001]